MSAPFHIDGLQQFDDWYATLSSVEVDAMLININPLFDSFERELDRALKLSNPAR